MVISSSFRVPTQNSIKVPPISYRIINNLEMKVGIVSPKPSTLPSRFSLQQFGPSCCYGAKKLRTLSEILCSQVSVKCRPSKRWFRGKKGSKLGKRWVEYQGSNNWEGLLDPLDDYLRGEILRYGQFVEAAYQSFDFDTSSPTYAMCKFSRNSLLAKTGCGDAGYKMTKNLRATCGVQLPRWMECAPPWVTMQSSWIGFVAVCQDKDEIERIGRRDVVIAYRGTATCLEWLENLRVSLTSLPDDQRGGAMCPMVQSGFLSLYTSATATCPSLQTMIRDEVERIVKMYSDDDVPLSFTITGHSLGAALATLTAHDIVATCRNAPMVTVLSFGGPRVGNKSFTCQLEKSRTRILRIVNTDDVVTKVPGFVIDNNNVAESLAVHVGSMLPSWLRKSVEEMRLGYAEVGRELRLCSKESPYLSKMDVATCHELGTYLHLVDEFVSSTSPFRASRRKVPNEHHGERFAYR